MNEKGLGRDEKGFSFRAPISSGPNPARPNFSLRVATTYTSFERETDSQAVYRERIIVRLLVKLYNPTLMEKEQQTKLQTFSCKNHNY